MNPTDLPAESPIRAQPSGPLEWRWLIKWLREDHLISSEDAERTKKRFGAAHSKQHPLVRLAAAGLTRKGTTKLLDTEALTEWLAGKSKSDLAGFKPAIVDDLVGGLIPESKHAAILCADAVKLLLKS